MIHSFPFLGRSLTITIHTWSQIDDTRCHLVVESGDFTRIPKQGLAIGHSPPISFTSDKDVRVAKLSDNRSEPISALRVIAADNDCFVNS